LSLDLSEVDVLGKPAVFSNLFEGFESHLVVFDEHLKEQILEVLELGAEHLEVGGGSEDLLDGLARVVAVEGGQPDDEFVEEAGERPYVMLRTEVRLFEELWRAVVDGADEEVLGGGRAREGGVDGEAEVAELGVAVFADEDVLWLQTRC